MQLSVSDVKVMVNMADALHWLFFGILAKHPHDETYKYLFPFFKRVQDGLTALAKGNDPLDADVNDLFKRIKSALDEASPVQPALSPRLLVGVPKSSHTEAEFQVALREMQAKEMAKKKARKKSKSPAKKSSGKRRVCR